MRRFVPWFLLLPLVLFLWTGASRAGVVIDPKDAPEWRVSEWINGDPGRLVDHKGRVVIIEFFQLWCPGCNSFSLPLLKEWDQRYGDREDVLIVSIHTVFEGFEFQTPERLRNYVAEKGIRHIVGIDDRANPDDRLPVTMTRFNTGGTPHIAIVDKEGKLVFSYFGQFDPAPVESYIDRLLKEKTTHRPRPKPRVADFDPLLSGAFNFWIDQESRSCGPAEPRRKARLQLTVHDDRIEVKAPRPFLGIDELTLDYEARTGRFHADLTRRTNDRGIPVTVRLELDGSFVRGSAPPRIDYTYAFSLLSGREPERNCDIEGQGTGERVGF